MSGEERYLWSFSYLWHRTSRMWWAYFKNWSELQACIVELQEAFPCFELQQLEIRPDGLIICKQSFASDWSKQERRDALEKQEARQRDELFFPLAPGTCGYLASFVAGLGQDAFLLQKHCETLSRARSLLR